MTVAAGGQLRRVSRILSRSGSELRACQAGWVSVNEIHPAPSGLILLRVPEEREPRRLRRLAKKPEALMVAPLPLPSPMRVSEETVAEVQRELWQRVRKGGGRQAEAWKPSPDDVLPWRQSREEPSDQFNVADLQRASDWSRDLSYLKDLISRVGWIDARRFGYAASNAAFFLVQHSWEPPLMLAALPWIQRDVEAGLTEGEDYALLYDRLQLALGEKQRYGTQVGFDSAHTAFLFPTEHPEKVDDLRKELGMLPLSDYVKLVAHFNRAYAPDRVVFLEECASK